VTNLHDDSSDWSRAQAGDGHAFGIIYDRHHARLHRHALSIAPTPADADDIVAVAFLEAWRRRSSVRFVDNSILPWLLVTATNAGHNLRRSARRYQALLNRLPVAPAPQEYDVGEASEALRHLSLPDQRILTLSVVLDLSEKDVAALLGIPPGTVKSRLSRAKARLAARLSPVSTTPSSYRKEAPRGL
jgi:RNA polymerase sigma-70 factor (ECF subfamily)